MDLSDLRNSIQIQMQRLRALLQAALVWCGKEPQRRVILFLFAFSPAMLTGYWISECAVTGGDWELIDVAEIYAAPAMRASFYDGQFGENHGNLSRVKNYARFEKEFDLAGLPTDEEVDLIFWVANTETMELLPMKQAFRFKRKDVEPGIFIYKKS